MKNSANPLNRTSCYVIEKITSKSLQSKAFEGFVCPRSNKPLIKEATHLYCKDSNLAYPLIEGIPVLGSIFINVKPFGILNGLLFLLISEFNA